MIEKLMKAIYAFGIISFSVVSTCAQENSKCDEPIYTAKEVTQRARITRQADLSVVYTTLGNGNRTHAVVDAVLCRSGRVTDIKVVEISPVSITESLVGAVSEIEFRPAEMNWHTVSQRQRFEFSINDDSRVGEVNPAKAAGRIIERLDVAGNRRFSFEEIKSWIKTRAGETYNQEQIQKDFAAILATGYFDKVSTRVFTEEGERGGLGVVFEVRELPVVGVVSFEGLKIDPAVIRKAWKDANIDLQTGNPYWYTAGKAAVRVIKQVLDANALDYSAVDVRSQLLASQTVNLVFVIKTQ